MVDSWRRAKSGVPGAIRPHPRPLSRKRARGVCRPHPGGKSEIRISKSKTGAADSAVGGLPRSRMTGKCTTGIWNSIFACFLIFLSSIFLSVLLLQGASCRFGRPPLGFLTVPSCFGSPGWHANSLPAAAFALFRAPQPLYVSRVMIYYGKCDRNWHVFCCARGNSPAGESRSGDCAPFDEKTTGKWPVRTQVTRKCKAAATDKNGIY